MRKIWDDEAWEDYLYWQDQDRKTLRRINRIIKDIERSPYQGIGKPEQLKHDLQDCWSRHIDETNRIVYRIDEDGRLVIYQCRAHYRDA
jgi:toxin YoeB